jgi:hypothetical protein
VAVDRPARDRIPEPPDDQAAVARGVQIGQEDRERLADDPASIHGNAESAEGETGAFQIQQLTAGQVDGDLLSVALPATSWRSLLRRGGLKGDRPPYGKQSLTLGFDRGASAGRTEQLGDSRQAYPP